MNLLKNKTVFITGATAGIGKSCVYAFAKEGSNLIICARRQNLLNELSGEIKEKYGVKIFSFELDVSDRNAVESAVKNLPDEWKEIDVLVNNAGLARGLNKLYEGDINSWEEMLNTNVKGLLYVTRAILPKMVERKSGHIINIGSIAGHQVYPGGGVYCATKHAVDAITKTLHMELIDKNIRVSTVDPGMVETDFSNVRFYGDTERANKVYQGIKPLTGDDIADAVIYCASRPANVNIGQIIMTPQAQASVTIAYREA